jgi:hypothetical protein
VSVPKADAITILPEGNILVVLIGFKPIIFCFRNRCVDNYTIKQYLKELIKNKKPETF